jgi:hypothetical protein
MFKVAPEALVVPLTKKPKRLKSRVTVPSNENLSNAYVSVMVPVKSSEIVPSKIII